MKAPKVPFRYLFAALLIVLGGFAVAQDYPSRLVRIIVPFPPGGSSDIYARIVANELQQAWGKSVIVENRPGGTGVIGTQAVRQSAPDGYTLLFTSNTAHVLGPLLQEPRPFDAVADFTPISKALRFPLYLIVHPSIPTRSLTEFMAFARSKPGQLNYASSGQGGGSHLVAELFNAATGIKAIHVPYKGAAPALQAVLTGEAQYLFNNIGTSQPFVIAGKLRGFAVTGERRSPALPEIPVIAEAGIQGLENAYTWLGLFGPAQLPPAVLGKLSAEVIRIMHLPEISRRVLNDGYEVVANTPAQFARDMQAEVATWSRVIREKGIKAE
ncbi:MAG: tripartite tricarboxylate transporter substrate binding protein [Sulfuricaulis sp.]|nr:tripartite tricarboxylate transporter substrate binding protein [Sulfuricaulis sp.]